MVLQKRMRYEFSGFRVPNVPRGSRSMRGKRCVQKRVMDKVSGNEMCAFELLASVAGELLLNKENSSVEKPEAKTGASNSVFSKNKNEFGLNFCEGDQKSSDLAPRPSKTEPDCFFGECLHPGSIVIISEPSGSEIERVGSGKPSDFNQTTEGGSAIYRPQRVVDRRIRKLLASKFWKVSEKEEDVKPLFYSRKMCYKRRRTQNLAFKRRRLFERGSVSSTGLPVNGECFPCSPKMQIKREADSSDTIVHGGNGETASSMATQKFAFNSDDYHVKLRIKSFKVPELFIEIPETATVGSLKRTVMEAVTAILGGGLRIGVHLQGKKVRDDDKTLLQAGISHSEELDSLGFTIEPNSLPSPQAHTPEEQVQPLLVPIADASEPLKSGRWEATSAVGGESKALVAVPGVDVEALAVFPMDGKRRRSETGPRRVRRPFSVSEVEALVRAVEELGTGRWRDVKVCAFDGYKHRTYVDLKDKWKTLVHTARIAPQRRRGEQVPQELLDRVLSAHAHWAQHQQPKPDPGPLLA
ncbi:telomere repeat-binding protein 2-like [Wolffia australiana]